MATLLEMWGIDPLSPEDIIFHDGHKIAKQLGISEKKLTEVIDVLKDYEVLR